jgi:hypothetical protein
MCYSATASFSAGVLLLGVGTLTLASAHRPREWPFAAIPLLFAIQQLIEGVIWLTFSADAPVLNTVMTHAYSFFSHVLWPVYLPVAVLMIEPPGGRQRTLSALVVAGAAVGGYLLYILVAFPVVSRPTGQHVEYDSPHFFAAAVMTLYLIATDRPARRVRLAALLCGCGDDAVPDLDHGEPVAVHASKGSGLRRSGAPVVRRGLLLLCNVVHLGVVLLRSPAEHRHLPPLCMATHRTRWLATDAWSPRSI